MYFKEIICVCFLLWTTIPTTVHAKFIRRAEELAPYSKKSDFIMVASEGRSGSTMLTEQLQKYIHPRKVLKTHMLPPPQASSYELKTIFIFADPCLAAESVLHKCLITPGFANAHFRNMEGADQNWLAKLGGPKGQNAKHNLLSEDVLGVTNQLECWLYKRTKPTTPEKATIFAVKSEDLWNEETLEALRAFIHVPNFELPEYRPRGQYKLSKMEKYFRKLYNQGTETEPKYAAYERARFLWNIAPSYQYLRFSSQGQPLPD